MGLLLDPYLSFVILHTHTHTHTHTLPPSTPSLPVHQAMETIERLEHQLAQEQQLRGTTDSYLLELQRARQQATACVADVMEGQQNIRKHCTSIK